MVNNAQGHQSSEENLQFTCCGLDSVEWMDYKGLFFWVL